MRKLFSGFLIGLILLLCSSTAMAAVTLAWDAWTSADGVKPEGYYMYWKTDTQTTYTKSADTGFVNQFTIPDVFDLGTTYTFYVTAWAWSTSDPQTRLESGASNTVLYVNRGPGNNNPLGTTVGAPTSFNVLNQTTVGWAASIAVAPAKMPVGYRVYGYKSVGGSVASAALITESTTTSTSLGSYVFDLNVEYKLFVRGFVYGVDGISVIESTGSNEDFYVRRTGTSTTAPTAPKNMKITVQP